MPKTSKPITLHKPKAVAVGFFYSKKGPRSEVLRLEIDLKHTTTVDRHKAVNRIMRLAELYDFCK